MNSKRYSGFHFGLLAGNRLALLTEIRILFENGRRIKRKFLRLFFRPSAMVRFGDSINTILDRGIYSQCEQFGSSERFIAAGSFFRFVVTHWYVSTKTTRYSIVSPQIMEPFHKTGADFWHLRTVHIYHQSHIDIMGYIPYNSN